MSKMTNCQNDHGGRELNGEPTHTIIWEPYRILQSFVPHSLHSFNDFILLFIHSFPIRLLSHSFSYSSTLTVIPFNLTISLWHENETLSWIAKTSKNGHFCVTTMAWFWQRNSSLLWNFSFKFHVHVLCGCRQKLNDCQLCRFQNGCLVILNNVQLQSTHCPLPPSPMGRGYPSRSLIYNF